MASLELLSVELKLEIVSHIDDISTLLNLKSTTKQWYEVIQKFCARKEDELTIGPRLPTTIAAVNGMSISDYRDWCYQGRFRYMFIFSLCGTGFYCPIDVYIDDTWWARILDRDHTAIEQAFAEIDRGLHTLYAKAIGYKVSHQRTFRERRNFWTAFWLLAKVECILDGHRHPERPASGAIRAQISGTEDNRWLLKTLTNEILARRRHRADGADVRGVRILGREGDGFPGPIVSSSLLV